MDQKSANPVYDGHILLLPMPASTENADLCKTYQVVLMATLRILSQVHSPRLFHCLLEWMRNTEFEFAEPFSHLWSNGCNAEFEVARAILVSVH